MELRDFVKEALVQIIEGVRDAQDVIKKPGGKINPIQQYFGEEKHSNTIRDEGGQVIHMVEFDVAITVKEDAAAKGGVGLVVGPIAIGTRADASEQNTSTNRIKFPVPITYPRGL
jgi:hypothetical protein